jgi:hypothetical protein
MTNTDFADDDVLPSCGLVNIIETLREQPPESMAMVMSRRVVMDGGVVFS